MKVRLEGCDVHLYLYGCSKNMYMYIQWKSIIHGKRDFNLAYTCTYMYQGFRNRLVFRNSKTPHFLEFEYTTNRFDQDHTVAFQFCLIILQVPIARAVRGCPKCFETVGNCIQSDRSYSRVTYSHQFEWPRFNCS